MMDNFINGGFIKDLSICDRLIKCFNETDEKFEGVITTNGTRHVDKLVKASTQMHLSQIKNKDLVTNYNKELQAVLENYIDKYKYCNHYAPFKILQNVSIQYYKPNEGYHAWHTERVSDKHPNASRHLAFMTYLNDVEDGGETEFYYQELKVKPQKGYTLIWPADWTHTHRGITSPTQDKYIVTGWYNYV